MTLEYYNFSFYFSTWIIASKKHDDDDSKVQIDKTFHHSKILYGQRYEISFW